jgi:zinc/manganese transport system substrate-binding protein
MRTTIPAWALTAAAWALVPAPSAAAVRVVTTTADLAAIAREVGGDRVDVAAIAAGFQDPHFVDAKPSYLLQLQRADLFVQVGLELEVGWAPTLVGNARNARILPGAPGFVDASAGVAPLQIPSGADRGAGDIHPYGNPHYWLDPANGKQIAANIAAGLERVDPAGAAVYGQRRAEFDVRLDAALARWSERAGPLRDLPVVAYHNSWPYFERRFGFRVVGFVEPKPGIPPSGKYVAELAAEMKRQGVKLILMSTFYDQKTAKLVANLSGARVVTLANSVEGFPEVKSYFDLFETNLSRLLAALGE